MRLFSKHKYLVIAVIALTGVAFFINSCKKDNSDTVSYFLTSGSWTLASVQKFTYLGDTRQRVDTLNTSCTGIQQFTFTTSNTCTYSNYHCITQTSTGTWQLSPDNLTLMTSLRVKDTSKKAVIDTTGFGVAQIVNLGQYSLVLQTGYTSSYYTSKTPRVIYRYGFVHGQ